MFGTQIDDSVTMTTPVRADLDVTRTNIHVHPLEWFSAVIGRILVVLGFSERCG